MFGGLAGQNLSVEPPQSPPAGQQIELENMIDVLRLNALFDFAAYFAASKEIRKRIALEFYGMDFSKWHDPRMANQYLSRGLQGSTCQRFRQLSPLE
jgi:hypothetical protein